MSKIIDQFLSSREELRKRLFKIESMLNSVESEIEVLENYDARENEKQTIKQMLGLRRLEKDIYRLERHDIKQILLNINYRLRYKLKYN